MANCEKILIAGFSGAGKTSLLTEVKASAPGGWTEFLDLDQQVLEIWGSSDRTLAGMIDKIGWKRFRELEYQELMNWIVTSKGGVLALGGGTLTADVYQKLQLLPELKVIYLHAEFETCWNRLNSGSSEERPQVRKGKQELEELYQRRAAIFQQVPISLENREETSLPVLASQFWAKLLG